MMKKLYSSLIVLALLIVCAVLLPKKVQAAEIIDSGTCGSNLTWTLDDEGLLTISGTGAMRDYYYWNYAPWNPKRTEIKSVCILDGVTSIGNFAFYECTSLTSITIPDSLTSIGERAFEGCISLTSITIPNSVTIISSYAFHWCTSLTSITIPNSVTSISSYAFEGCTSLTSITIPDSVTSIGNYAFYECTSLTSITIPDSITSIGAYAFYECTSLTSITIPDSVTSIVSSAFEGCTSLTSITIPDSVTSIGPYAFYGCTSLTSITIPDSVTSIGRYAFCKCYELKDVYYAGTQEQWGTISIGADNYDLTNATIHYNHVHDYSPFQPVTVAATCTENGYIEYTCVYGENNREILPMLGHDFVASGATVAPTCTEQGYSEGTCSRCGTQGQTDLIAALGHDYTGPEVTVAPTCTENGYSGNRCTRCDNVAQTDIVPALGHQMAVLLAVDPTCTKTGLSVGSACERCGLVGVSQTVVPALGHSYEDGVCTVCGGMKNPFTDVPENSFYYEPVMWAVKEGITNGATATTFNPNGTCLRAHVVTFLHRADGNPAPTSNKNPFTDVKSSDFFYKPVLWAVEKDITNGTTATTFGSYENCNRAAVVTFLWRAAGSPEPKSSNNPFKDVKDTDFFYKPVLWAVEEGITNGVDATHFGPTTACNRAQVVTFLYRAYN